MTQKVKQMLSKVLCIAMVLSMMPTLSLPALAADGDVPAAGEGTYAVGLSVQAAEGVYNVEDGVYTLKVGDTLTVTASLTYQVNGSTEVVTDGSYGIDSDAAYYVGLGTVSVTNVANNKDGTYTITLSAAQVGDTADFRVKFISADGETSYQSDPLKIKVTAAETYKAEFKGEGFTVAPATENSNLTATETDNVYEIAKSATSIKFTATAAEGYKITGLTYKIGDSAEVVGEYTGGDYTIGGINGDVVVTIQTEENAKIQIVNLTTLAEYSEEAEEQTTWYKLDGDKLTVTNDKACVVLRTEKLFGDTDEARKAAVKVDKEATWTRVNAVAVGDAESAYTFDLSGAKGTVVIALKGDANTNGKIDASDASIIAQYIGGATSMLSGALLKIADTNVNDKIDASDASNIRQSMGGSTTAISW